MTGFLTEDCFRTMEFSRASPRQERQRAPTAGNIGVPRVGRAEIGFIKTHLSYGSCWNSCRPDARHAVAGSGGGRSSAIRRGISANSILGTATSAIWNETPIS